MPDQRGDPRVLRRVLAREAIEAGDAARALGWVDELPEDERADWLVEVWMLAGSPRAVKGVIGGAKAMLERARAFVAEPPKREVPSGDYERMKVEAERLAGLGRAAELAMMHLGLANASPRADWRVVHIEHAASLALGLGDARISALVRAYEALRDAELGENEDAHEAVGAAIEMGIAADEPRAVELATRVGAGLPPLEPPPAPPELDGAVMERVAGDRISEPEGL